MFPLFRFFEKPRIGLALGSGGAKGIAHIAVMERLLELGVPVHCLAGSSIGAIAAVLYCEGRLERARKDLLEMDRKAVQDIFEFLIPVKGLMGTRGIMKFLSRYIPAGREIECYTADLRIIATDYRTGAPVVFREGNVLDALRASISIPGIFPAVPYGDSWLIDGGVSMPLPVSEVRAMGASRVIAVNLHPAVKEPVIRPRGRKKQLSRNSSAQALGPVRIMAEPVQHVLEQVKNIADFGTNAYLSMLGYDNGAARLSSMPTIYENILQTLDIMNFYNTDLALSKDPPDILIEPDLLHFDSLDFHKAPEALEEGRRACALHDRELKRLAVRKPRRQ